MRWARHADFWASRLEFLISVSTATGIPSVYYCRHVIVSFSMMIAILSYIWRAQIASHRRRPSPLSMQPSFHFFRSLPLKFTIGYFCKSSHSTHSCLKVARFKCLFEWMTDWRYIYWWSYDFTFLKLPFFWYFHTLVSYLIIISFENIVIITVGAFQQTSLYICW